jgi:hypothetical protein
MSTLTVPITVTQAKELTYEEARDLTDRIKESLADRKYIKPQHPAQQERAMQWRIAEMLRDRGLEVTMESRMPSGGRCDIAVWEDDQAVWVVEVKVSAVLRAIGQLFGYSEGWAQPPRLTIACCGATKFDQVACKQAGIELWFEDQDFPGPDGAPAPRSDGAAA